MGEGQLGCEWVGEGVNRKQICEASSRRQTLSCFLGLFVLTLCGSSCPYFTDKVTEGQRGGGSCPHQPIPAALELGLTWGLTFHTVLFAAPGAVQAGKGVTDRRSWVACRLVLWSLFVLPRRATPAL